MIVLALLVLFPLLLGLLASYYGYKRSARRRNQTHDEGRRQDVEDGNGIGVRGSAHSNKRYDGSQWYGAPGNATTNPTSMEKTLASGLAVEYTGGEGLVDVPQRVLLAVEEGKEKTPARPQRPDSHHDQERHESGAWDWEKDGYGNSTIQKAQVVTLTTSGLAAGRPVVQRVEKTYDPRQPVALEIWSKINNRQLPPLRQKPPEMVEQDFAPGFNRGADYVVSEDSNKHMSHVQRGLSTDLYDTGATGQEADRAAETRRKMEEAERR